jgi:hypothetical protein
MHTLGSIDLADVDHTFGARNEAGWMDGAVAMHGVRGQTRLPSTPLNPISFITRQEEA